MVKVVDDIIKAATRLREMTGHNNLSDLWLTRNQLAFFQERLEDFQSQCQEAGIEIKIYPRDGYPQEEL